MTLPRFVRALAALTLLSLVVLTGCELTSSGVSEQIANVQTIQALTPSPTLSPTVTDTPLPTGTATATLGPSPTGTSTPLPTATPLPPTPTPNPALAGFGFCNQRVGPTDGLFSARLAELSASGTPAYEQVVLRFDLANGSAPLAAMASCLGPADLSVNDPESASPYAIRLSLPGWLRDERYASSALTQTLSFSGTRTITGARVIVSNTPDAGVALLIAMSEPLPFRLSIERNPTRLVLAVARNSILGAASDQLGVPAGGGKPALSAPLFTLFDGDIWRLEAGSKGDSPGIKSGLVGATNLTHSPETETHLAVSPDGKRVAFCRAAPGLDPADAELPVPSLLWLMDADGKNQRPLAQVGVSCADPAFSPNGATLAFAVDETGAVPIQRTIYSIPVTGGQPRRLNDGVDEWSRFAPQWLAKDALVFAATSQDGRSTLLLRQANGSVVDVGAPVLIRENAAPPYAGFGRPLAARDGSRFAVEVLRGDAPGADLAVFDAAGGLLEIIGAQRVVPVPTPIPSPTRTSLPTSTAATAVVTGTVTQPTATLSSTVVSTATLLPTATATVTATAAVKATVTPTVTTRLSAFSLATVAVKTTATPTATVAVKATGTPTATVAVKVTGTPTATVAVKVTGTPTATVAVKTTGTPTATVAVKTTATPTATVAVKTTATATLTATPGLTVTAVLSGTPTLVSTAEAEPPPEETRSGPYWTRPVAWDSQGRLLYLSTLCASQATQDYQLSRWIGAQRSELMAAGQTLGAIGPATMAGDGLAYVLSEQGPSGIRGPVALTSRGRAALWLWDLASGARGELLTTERGLLTLER